MVACTLIGPYCHVGSVREVFGVFTIMVRGTALSFGFTLSVNEFD